MREVMLYTEKKEFKPGEEVNGHIVVSSDKSFTCNRIVLKIRGREYTHYRAGKVQVTDTHNIIEEDLNVWEGGEIQSGDTKFEFSFMLPEDIPPIHVGSFGRIDYSIESVVEVSRALDPKSKLDIKVYAKQPEYIPEPENPAPISEEGEHLCAEIPTDIIRPNKPLMVRFLVRERPRIKGVRLDIAKHDYVVCQGRNLESTNEISEKHIPITFNDFDRWIEETVMEDWSTIAPFEGSLIKSKPVLKVVLEVGLSIDPFIEFPLRFSGERREREGTEDLFDSIEIDLDW